VSEVTVLVGDEGMQRRRGKVLAGGDDRTGVETPRGEFGLWAADEQPWERSNIRGVFDIEASIVFYSMGGEAVCREAPTVK
jgi:hypothetical protein